MFANLKPRPGQERFFEPLNQGGFYFLPRIFFSPQNRIPGTPTFSHSKWVCHAYIIHPVRTTSSHLRRKEQKQADAKELEGFRQQKRKADAEEWLEVEGLGFSGSRTPCCRRLHLLLCPHLAHVDCARPSRP